MKHLFASGEIIYLKNKRNLEHGTLIAEYIEYDSVDESNTYNAIGEINGKAVSVKFRIKEDSYDDIKFRYSIKILMQSDLIQAEWKDYEVEYI